MNRPLTTAVAALVILSLIYLSKFSGLLNLYTLSVGQQYNQNKITPHNDNDHDRTGLGASVTETAYDANSTPDPGRGKKPLNIVLLYADDWSFSTLGAMGNDYVQTPVIDDLASQGVLFTHACVVTSVCMQSRATLYTGQYSSRHKTIWSFRNITMYEPDRWNQTLYPLMKKAGYHVGFFGKWHHSIPVPGNPFHHRKFYSGSHMVTRNNVTRHVTEWNERDALQFLEERPRDDPFFLTVSFFATHALDGNPEQYVPMNTSMSLYTDAPVPVPKTLTERHWQDMPYFFHDDKNIGRKRFNMRFKTPQLHQKMMKNTLRMATEVDTACGNILDKLKEQGVLDNTLVIFTSDNGNIHGQHGLADKWLAYEESLRVPLVIKDPRMSANLVGTKNSEFVLNIDLAPTILSAAGIPPPEVMQGKDIASLYLAVDNNETAKNWRKEFLYEFRDSNKGIPNSVALVRKGFKYIFWEEHNYEQLFNLENDPYEENDLWNATGEPVLRELRETVHMHSDLIKR